MISVNAIDYQASQLIDRALFGREPDHLRIILLEWATAFEMLLALEGAKKAKLPRCACMSASSPRGLQSLRRALAAPGKLWPQRTHSSASDTFGTVKARPRGQKMKRHRKIIMDKKTFL